MADIEQWDLVAFRRLIDAGLAAVMMAHVVYSQVDRQPAGYSRVWIRDILRHRLKFQGLVFSDDLSMAGACLAGDPAARAHAALAAGCDMVLVCNDRTGAVQVAAALERSQDPVAHTRMARLHGKHPVTLEALHADPRWEQAVAAVQGYEDMPELDLEA